MKILLIIVAIAFFVSAIYADKREAEAENRREYVTAGFYSTLSFKLSLAGFACMLAFFILLV